jgi:hypothetical protein
MPIEIRELNIRINVADEQPAASGNQEITQDREDEIIARCVEQVMEIISKKQER